MCGRFVLFTTGHDLVEAVSQLPGVTDVAAPDGTPPPLFNARRETVAEKPSFRAAFKERRRLN